MTPIMSLENVKKETKDATNCRIRRLEIANISILSEAQSGERDAESVQIDPGKLRILINLKPMPQIMKRQKK